MGVFPEVGKAGSEPDGLARGTPVVGSKPAGRNCPFRPCSRCAESCGTSGQEPTLRCAGQSSCRGWGRWGARGSLRVSPGSGRGVPVQTRRDPKGVLERARSRRRARAADRSLMLGTRQERTRGRVEGRDGPGWSPRCRRSAYPPR